MGNRRRTFIREWREHRGLSQEQLGEKVGLTKGQISKIEQGKAGILLETLQRMAAALDCTDVDLLTRMPSQHQNLWTAYERATTAQRRQFERLAQAIIEPDET